jgi:BNR repeat-like domain
MGTHSLAVLLLSTILAGHAYSQTRRPGPLPLPPGTLLSALTPEPGYFTEPSIAVNPRNPQQVVAAFQVNARIAYSTDAGRTWTLAEATASPDYKVSGDVSVTFDNQGHAILCYIAFDKLGTFNYWGQNASRNGIFIRRSLDGGKTWEKNQIPVAYHSTAPGIPFEDKPYIVADTGNGKHGGTLYIGWTRWNLTNSQLVLSRSTDGGKTWSAPIELDEHPGLPRDDNGALEGFDGAVGPDGTLYSVWNNRDGIVLTSSHDGGRHFSHSRTVIRTAPGMFAIQGVSRANGFPQIAVDPHAGRRGRLYITWSDYRNGDLDVFCAASNNGGKSWSEPVRVNNDAVHNGADQYFQWMTVDPVDGSVNAVFYDRRGDSANRKQIVVLARSEDRGNTFRNFGWTSESFDPGGVFMGDYSGIAALGGHVYGAWTERPTPQKKQGAASPSGTHAGTPRDTIIRVGVAQFGK